MWIICGYWIKRKMVFCLVLKLHQILKANWRGNMFYLLNKIGTLILQINWILPDHFGSTLWVSFIQSFFSLELLLWFWLHLLLHAPSSQILLPLSPNSEVPDWSSKTSPAQNNDTTPLIKKIYFSGQYCKDTQNFTFRLLYKLCAG